jgi:hypothetical protein
MKQVNDSIVYKVKSTKQQKKTNQSNKLSKQLTFELIVVKEKDLKTNQLGGSVSKKDDSEEGNSASEQNKINMNEKKNIDKHLGELTDYLKEEGVVNADDVADILEKSSKKGFRKLIEEEAKDIGESKLKR